MLQTLGFPCCAPMPFLQNPSPDQSEFMADSDHRGSNTTASLLLVPPHTPDAEENEPMVWEGEGGAREGEGEVEGGWPPPKDHDEDGRDPQWIVGADAEFAAESRPSLPCHLRKRRRGHGPRAFLGFSGLHAR